MSDHSLTDKNETLLLENVDAVVKSLNSLGEKRHISSQHVVARLVYLYNRLTDFLSVNDSSDEDIKSGVDSLPEDRKDSVHMALSYSDVECDVCHNTITIYKSDYDLSMALHIQEFGEQHRMANTPNSFKNVTDGMSKIEIGKKENMNQSSRVEPDIGLMNTASGSTSISKSDDLGPVECGICRQNILIKNNDFKLSMQLHIREEIHQRAVDLENRAIEEAMQRVEPLKQLGFNLGHYITYSNATKYYCELCQIFMSGIDNAKQHIAGSSHNNKLAKKAQDEDIILLSDGVYFCKLCSAPLGSSSNALDHRAGKTHCKKLTAKKELSENYRKIELPVQLLQEDRIWLRIPSVHLAHKKFFKNASENVLYCVLCATQVPKTEVNLLSHIRGRQHSRSSTVGHVIRI